MIASPRRNHTRHSRGTDGWAFFSGKHLALALFVLALTCAAFNAQSFSGSAASAQNSGYRIVHVYPHDPAAFTQGLIYVDGMLYESTGLNGRSTLRSVDLTSGRVLQRVDVPKEYFAEGLTAWHGTLVQLTWQAHTAFVYDRFSFRLLRTFHYEEEGWGLTEDGRRLILSDGTAFLRFLDPQTFHETGRIQVTENGKAVLNLNELEYLHGEVFANIWHSDRIVRISPKTGRVVGSLDLSGLLPADQRASAEAVLNGIAYDAKSNHLLITGKLWPKLFEIELLPAKGPAP